MGGLGDVPEDCLLAGSDPGVERRRDVIEGKRRFVGLEGEQADGGVVAGCFAC